MGIAKVSIICDCEKRTKNRYYQEFEIDDSIVEQYNGNDSQYRKALDVISKEIYTHARELSGEVKFEILSVKYDPKNYLLRLKDKAIYTMSFAIISLEDRYYGDRECMTLDVLAKDAEDAKRIIENHYKDGCHDLEFEYTNPQSITKVENFIKSTFKNQGIECEEED